MANITTLLNNIKQAIYGKDVRNSIHDAILQCYIDATTSGNANAEVIMARGKFDTLKDRLDYIDNKMNKDENITSYDNYYLTYEMFGAVGDGVTDDSQAIMNAHIQANLLHLPVKGDGRKKYYIKEHTKIPIKTHTDWNGAELIFEEDGTERISNPFEILPSKDPIVITDFSGVTIGRSTTKIDKLAGNGLCLVDVINKNKKQYIRKGSNADSGYNQTEQFIIDDTGKILTPIYFNFDNISSITLYPLEKEVIYVGNAVIRTKENTYNDATYIQRGILCKRSNTIIYGINHIIDENGLEVAPSRGVVYFHTCANVVIKDSILTPRRSSNNVGTYELNFYKVVNAVIDNVIDRYMLDEGRWGSHTSNYLKNLTVNNCQLSRVDAHKGVWGITLKDTILGHQGLRLVGGGDLILENITSYATNLVAFRKDYGSTWLGKVRIKNVEHKPITTTSQVSVFRFENDMSHDFGYNCYMPQTIEVEDYYLDDSNENSNDGLYKIINYVESFDSTVDYTYKVRFPREMRFKNFRNASSKGFTVWSGAIAPFYAANNYVYTEKGENYSDTAKNIIIKQNCIIELDNVQLTSINTSAINSSSNNIFAIRGLGRQANDNYLSVKNRVVPQIIINNCKDVCISLMGFPFILNMHRSTIRAANCVANGSRNITYVESCIFDAIFPDTSIFGYRFNNVTANFVGCYFDKPTYESGTVSSDTINNAYGFLDYSNVKSSDDTMRSLCSFFACRIHPDIHPAKLFTNLSSFNYDFNSSYGMKKK